MILSLSVMDTVDTMAEGSGLDPEAFWEHSLICAVCAEDLATRLHEAFADRIFVAGLLHDIGKLVLSRHAPDAFRQAAERVRVEDIGPVDAERSVLEMDHAQVGRYLMDQWQFPLLLKESVGMHHDPSGEEIAHDATTRMAAVLGLADILSNMRTLGGSRAREQEQSEALREQLGLSEQDLGEIAEGLDDRVAQIANTLGLENILRQSASEILQKANAELGRINLLVQESEERYRGIFESIQDVYLEVDVEDGRILEISPSIEQLGGYDREEMLDTPFSALYAHPEIWEELLAALEESGHISDYEVGFVNKAGEDVPCSLSVRRVAGGAGIPPRMVGTIRDITERKRAEEVQSALQAQLQELNKGLTLAYAQMRDQKDEVSALQYREEKGFLIDREGHILGVTESALEATGQSRTALLERSILDLVDDASIPELRRAINQAWIGASSRIPLRMIGGGKGSTAFEARLMGMNMEQEKRLLVLLREEINEGDADTRNATG